MPLYYVESAKYSLLQNKYFSKENFELYIIPML